MQLSVSENNSTTFSNHILRIGLEEDTYPGCDHDLQKLFVCSDIVARSVGYWLKMIWNGPMELVRYPASIEGGWNAALYEDLRLGKIDVNPLENVIIDEYVSNFTILSTLSFEHYKFYTKLPTDAENGIQFLLYPFHWALWIATCILVSITCSLAYLASHSQSCRKFPHYDDIVKIFVLFGVFRAFMYCIYSSHLSALLTIQNSDIPIKSLEHLVQKIYKGKTAFYLEGTSSWRWLLLTEENFKRPERLIPLYNALNATGSLKIERNITALCQRVAQTENAIFLAYDDLVLIECPQFCFWTYKITEIPIVPAAFLMSKRSRFKGNGTISSHSILHFRRNALRMTAKVARCESVEFPQKGDLIGGRSLGAAFSLYGAGAFGSILIVCVEILSKFRCTSRKRTFALKNGAFSKVSLFHDDKSISSRIKFIR